MSADKSPAQSKNTQSKNTVNKGKGQSGGAAPQIHPHLQAEIQVSLRNGQAKPHSDLKDQPQLHPTLDSQLHPQGLVTTEAQVSGSSGADLAH